MNKVLELRKILRLDQKQFGLLLGIPYTTIRTWEEKNRIPKANIIEKFIKNIPGFNPNYFLDANEHNWFKPTTHTSTSKQNDSRGTSERLVTFYGRVAAGSPIATWGGGEFEMPIGGHPKIDKIKGQLYGFIVKGESFNQIYPNDTPIVATLIDYPAQKPKDDDKVITFFDTEPDTVKVMVKEFQWLDQAKGTFLLKPRSDDPHFKPTGHSFKGVRMMLKVHLGIRFADN